MSDYIFDQHQTDQELHRLQMIEDLFDPVTIEHLEQTGIRRGWRCLELGAGAGSIPKWIGETVGSAGCVVGLDLSTVHLQGLSQPNVHVIEGEFLDISLDSGFDLAHCRYVLIHNRRSDEMLQKLCQSLKRGGFLVVEEPDFTSARLLNPNADSAQQRVNNAICRMFEQNGLDPGFGLRLPAKVAAKGLQIIEVSSSIHLDRGGSQMARMMAASTRALADRYIDTGEASEADIEEYIQNCGHEQFWTVFYSTVSVIAKK